MGKGMRNRSNRVMDGSQKIKEYVYLDTTEMNSILAQIDNGITAVIKRMDSSTENISQANSSSKELEGNLSLGILSTKSEASKKLGKQVSNVQENGTTTQNAVETVYNDYAVDMLENRLKDRMQDLRNAKEGQFIKIQASIKKLIDFESLSTNFNSGMYKTILEKMPSNNPDFKNMYEESKETIKTLKATFPETILFKTSNAAVFADSNKFRINKAQMQLTTFSNRSLTIIGKVEAEYEGISDIYPTELDEMTKYMFGTLLTPLGIKEKDRLIKPIAMYFND